MAVESLLYAHIQELRLFTSCGSAVPFRTVMEATGFRESVNLNGKKITSLFSLAFT